QSTPLVLKKRLLRPDIRPTRARHPVTPHPSDKATPHVIRQGVRWDPFAVVEPTCCRTRLFVPITVTPPISLSELFSWLFRVKFCDCTLLPMSLPPAADHGAW